MCLHNALIIPLEAKIDARVDHLYRLTEEEYTLILNELKPPDPFRIAALNFYRDIARGVVKWKVYFLYPLFD